MKKMNMAQMEQVNGGAGIKMYTSPRVDFYAATSTSVKATKKAAKK